MLALRLENEGGRGRDRAEGVWPCARELPHRMQLLDELAGVSFVQCGLFVHHACRSVRLLCCLLQKVPIASLHRIIPGPRLYHLEGTIQVTNASSLWGGKVKKWHEKVKNKTKQEKQPALEDGRQKKVRQTYKSSFQNGEQAGRLVDCSIKHVVHSKRLL